MMLAHGTARSAINRRDVLKWQNANRNINGHGGAANGAAALVVLKAILLLATAHYAAASTSELAQCPPENILVPCSCTLSQIYCYNDNVVHLKPIFARVAAHLALIGASNQFISLELSGNSVRYLEANFTAGLSFERVALKNLRQLAAIDKQALVGTANRLQQLSLEEDTSLFITERNLARLGALLGSLPELTRLYLDARHLKTVPRHVFAHNKLQDLSFNYNRLRRGQISAVHNEAFYYLPSLRTVDLYGHSIDHLPRDTFRFQEDSAEFKTAIFLQDNKLNSSSLEAGLFESIKRRMVVYLNQNNLTFVPRQVFEPLLKANIENMVDLDENPLQMDCRNQWVSHLESRYKQFLGAKVYTSKDDYKVLVTLDPEDYSNLHCQAAHS